MLAPWFAGISASTHLEITHKIKASEDEEIYVRTFYREEDGYLKVIRQIHCKKKPDGCTECLIYADHKREQYSNCSHSDLLFQEMKNDTIAGHIATKRKSNQ